MKMTRAKQAVLGAALWIGAASAVTAHGTNDHIRGTVSEISDTAIVLTTAGKQAKTLSLSNTTTFERSGKPATLKDLKVGDLSLIHI